ncbi:MAG TPA: YIP1 family protein [Gemmatimonadaceae bacterium]|jgi:hypothetical protein
MTESTAAPAVAPKPASFWEDLIDIFYQPSDVFRRRAYSSPGPIFLFVVIAMAVITMATYPAIAPAFDGDYSRNIAKVMAENPQLTQEMVDKGQRYQAIGFQYFSGIVLAAVILFIAFLVWLVGKMFGAKETFGAALLITSYAYMPRVIGAVVLGLQGLLMDPTKLTSLSQLTLSPARFLDANTANPLTMAVLSRLDVTTLWETALLGIGIAVLGKVSRSKAIGFAITILIVGSLYQLRAAYIIS